MYLLVMGVDQRVETILLDLDAISSLY